MRGGKIDKLPRERIEEYNRNASKKKRNTNTKRDTGDNEKHPRAMAGIETKVLDTEHRF